MTSELLKGICIILLASSLGVMIYTFISAIRTAKKNKETDEATRKLFLAKMGQNTKVMKQGDAESSILKKPLSQIEPNKPKALNYDEFETDESIEDVGDKSLNDFFKKT